MFSLPLLVVSILLTVLNKAVFVNCAYIPSTLVDPEEPAPFNASSQHGPIAKRDLTDEEKLRLERLKNDYKGIWWEVAYPGAGDGSEDDNGGCTIAQFNILAEATRMAIDLADYSGADLLKDDSSFHMFFVRNRLAPEHGRWTSGDSVQAYGELHHNLLIPHQFPRFGKGSESRRTRVTYRCKDFDPPAPGTTGCAGGIVPAYTVKASFTGRGITTVFCPRFFAAGRYLNTITNGPRKQPSDFGDPRLISYEQMIVHEWMHAEVMGYKYFIDDVYTSLDPKNPGAIVPIYGMSRCHDYAWLYMEPPECAHINRESGKNADNYAWYFAHKYYTKKWGWTDDGAESLDVNNTLDSNNTLDINNTSACPQVSDGNSSQPVTWPSNCHDQPAIDSVDVTFDCDLEPPAILREQLGCNSNAPDSDLNSFTLANGYKAINDFCDSHKGQTVGTGSSSIADRLPNGDDKSTSIVMSLNRDTTPACESTQNPGVWSVQECVDNLKSAMNECDTNTTAAKKGGRTMASCIIYSISGSKRPVEEPEPAAPPAPPAPFQTGTCWIHVHQWRSNVYLGGDPFSFDSKSPYSLEVKMYDNYGATLIGEVERTSASDGNSLEVKSKLEDTLVCTPEEAEGEYIQFTLGTKSWTSSNKGNTEDSKASCTVGDWDNGYDRQMDCSFSCGWSGGKSSDGS